MATETKVLRLVQSNATGFANITPRDPLSTEINDASPLSADYIEWHIPSINEGTAYSIDLQASVDYYDSTPTLLGTLPVRAVSTSYNFNQNGMVANVISNDTVRISGTFANAFLDTYYEFVLEDGSTVQMAPNPASTFKALIEFEMPLVTTIDLEFPFNFTINTEFASATTESNTKSVGQWVCWTYNASETNILQLVASRPNA